MAPQNIVEKKPTTGGQCTILTGGKQDAQPWEHPPPPASKLKLSTRGLGPWDRGLVASVPAHSESTLGVSGMEPSTHGDQKSQLEPTLQEVTARTPHPPTQHTRASSRGGQGPDCRMCQRRKGLWWQASGWQGTRGRRTRLGELSKVGDLPPGSSSSNSVFPSSVFLSPWHLGPC